MKRLIVACIIVLFMVVPVMGEEKSIDTQMEIVRLQLDSISLEIDLKNAQFALLAQEIIEAKRVKLSKEYKVLKQEEAKLIAQLKELQVQKDKIEKKDTEE